MKAKIIVWLVILSTLMSGCVLNEQVSTNERAMWVDGGNATECVGPGIYTNLSTFIDRILGIYKERLSELRSQ